MNVKPDLIPFLDEMLFELSECKLDVCLVPSKVPECAADGGMIRVATMQNPGWYSELASMHPKINQRKRKKPQTSMVRKSVEYAIECMIKNRKSNSKYADFILGIAESRLEQVKYEMMNSPVPF